MIVIGRIFNNLCSVLKLLQPARPPASAADLHTGSLFFIMFTIACLIDCIDSLLRRMIFVFPSIIHLTGEWRCQDTRTLSLLAHMQNRRRPRLYDVYVKICATLNNCLKYSPISNEKQTGTRDIELDKREGTDFKKVGEINAQLIAKRISCIQIWLLSAKARPITCRSLLHKHYDAFAFGRWRDCNVIRSPKVRFKLQCRFMRRWHVDKKFTEINPQWF